MPFPKRVPTAAAFVLIGIVALLYSVLVVQQLLLGIGVAFALFVVAWFVYYEDTNRRTLTHGTIMVTLIYGVLSLQFPIAVVAACVVYLTAWLTGPDSPLNAPDTQIFPVESTAADESDSGE